MKDDARWTFLYFTNGHWNKGLGARHFWSMSVSGSQFTRGAYFNEGELRAANNNESFYQPEHDFMVHAHLLPTRLSNCSCQK